MGLAGQRHNTWPKAYSIEKYTSIIWIRCSKCIKPEAVIHCLGRSFQDIYNTFVGWFLSYETSSLRVLNSEFFSSLACKWWDVFPQFTLLTWEKKIFTLICVILSYLQRCCEHNFAIYSSSNEKKKKKRTRSRTVLRNRTNRQLKAGCQAYSLL